MIHFNSSRRHLHSALFILAIILIWRLKFVPRSVPSFIFHQPLPPSTGTRILITEIEKLSLLTTDKSSNLLLPPSRFFYIWEKASPHEPPNSSIALQQLAGNNNFQDLLECRQHPNQYTNHIRLPAIIQNISQVTASISRTDERVFWNPTVIALPYWSDNQYLVVSRILTHGDYQQTFLCEANICYVGQPNNARKGEKPCTSEDLVYVGQAGGLRCATPPISLSVAPTPAKHCSGKFKYYADIPGFHDPRIFYSGKGEPLMIGNTQ